jgi:tetratricopeptide (TPR) repeat protein
MPGALDGMLAERRGARQRRHEVMEDEQHRSLRGGEPIYDHYAASAAAISPDTPMSHTRLFRAPPRLLVALPLLALLTAGCASAGKRYEQGQQLEQQGRPADAAARYIDALRKDARLVDARERLHDSGSRAIADYLREAQAEEAGGRPADAAEAQLQADALRRDAAAVGVQLDAPADYDARRRATLDHALGQVLGESDAALQRGDFPTAVRLLTRAAERWEPSALQRADLDRARSQAHLSWGEAELSAGHFRSAWEHAAALASLAGGPTGAAEALQREALRRGTRRVAIFPVGADPGLRRDLPAGFLADLNDALALNQWQRPPLWLEVIDPRLAAREARRRTREGEPVQPSDAGFIARNLGGDLAVVLEVDSVRRGETGVETQRRTARTRAGVDTAYTVREGRMENWVRARWAVVEVGGYRGEVDRGDASAHSERRFRRAVFSGDWRTLQLTPSERALFEHDEDGGGFRSREVADDLAARLGREVYDALLRRVD